MFNEKLQNYHLQKDVHMGHWLYMYLFASIPKVPKAICNIIMQNPVSSLKFQQLAVKMVGQAIDEFYKKSLWKTTECLTAKRGDHIK